MKAHDLEAIGFLKLHYTPTEPNHAVRKEDLDALIVSTSSKPVFITDVEPLAEGNVGSKQYADTNPPNQILTGCVSDTVSVRVRFLAESGIAFTAPTVQALFDGVDLGTATDLTSVEGSSNSYRGFIDITLPGNGTVTLKSSQGTEATVSITVDAFGPVITSVLVASLPGDQTRVKAGDTVIVEGVVDNTAVDIRIPDAGVASDTYTATVMEANSAGEGYRNFSCTVEVSGRTGLQTLTAHGVNQLGTQGEGVSTAHIRLDQSSPNVTLTLGTPSNGSSFLGLNNTVVATIGYTAVDRTEFSFAHGTAGGALESRLSQRTLTVTDEVYSETGGILIRAWQDTNGTYAEFEFDVPIASLPLSLVSLSIAGAVMRGSSRVVPSVPVFGESMEGNLIASGIDSLANALPSTNNQDFFIEAPAGYGYFAYPSALGEATFVDLSTGMVGGWDGATWPADGSTGSTSGPAVVTLNGVEWYVYRTDTQSVVTPVMVTFQNPGLEVGEAQEVPHVKSSPEGIAYTLTLTFDQKVMDEPVMTPSTGTWSGPWSQVSDTVWTRDLLVKNSDARGAASFTGFTAVSPSGNELTETSVPLDYAVAGFTKRTITFSALSRTAPIGVPVFNVTNTRAQYSGSDSDLQLRTDTRDERASYSIVDSEGNYTSSMGTHIWLSDVDFASANTSGTLQVDIEELP